MGNVKIRTMTSNDSDTINKGLAGHDVSKPLDYIERCWEENVNGDRVTFIAFWDGQFAGWGHLIHRSPYAYFAESGIPEIQNFDVIPPFRKRGIGQLLLEAIEEHAFATCTTIGIGFGLYANYGAAQRLYVKRGFIPDGRGVMYHNVPVEPGRQVQVDDDLVLYLTKTKLSS